MPSLKKNYIFNTLHTLSGMLFPIITFPYVARVLMPEGIGQVNFYNAIISYITLFCSLGIPLYAIREVAKVKENKRLLEKTVYELLLLNVILTILGYIIVIVLCFTISQIQENKSLFILMSLNLIFVAIGCEWFYQGIEDFKYITIRGLIVKTICVILLFILVRDKDDLIYYGLYTVLGVVGGNLFNFIRLRKYVSLRFIRLKDLAPFSHLKGVSKIFLITVIGSIYLQLDSVMLGFISGNTAVGYYSSAIRLTKLIMGIVTSLGIVLLPKLSSLSDRNKSEFNDLLVKSYDYIILLAMPLSFGLLFLSETLIVLFCGDAYLPAIPSLRILSPIIFFIGVSYIAAQANLARGKESITIIVGFLGAVIDLILNFILIPKYAENGAAIATLITEGVIMMIYIILHYKNTHHLLFSVRHFYSCLAACVMMTLVILLFDSFHYQYWINAIVIPLIGCIIYVTGLFLLKDSTLISTYEVLIEKFRHK